MFNLETTVAKLIAVLIFVSSLIAMRPQGMFGPHLEESARIKKKRRTQFTAFQLDKLEATFSQSQYISPPRRQSLSQQLGLPEDSVKVIYAIIIIKRSSSMFTIYKITKKSNPSFDQNK